MIERRWLTSVDQPQHRKLIGTVENGCRGASQVLLEAIAGENADFFTVSGDTDTDNDGDIIHSDLGIAFFGYTDLGPAHTPEPAGAVLGLLGFALLLRRRSASAPGSMTQKNTGLIQSRKILSLRHNPRQIGL